MNVIDRFTGEHDFLSNFCVCPFKATLLDNRVVPTVEHVFQAMKAEKESQRDWVLSARGPGIAKYRGRSVLKRADWEEVKLTVMNVSLIDKFYQNNHLAAKLLATGDAELIEGNHWGDVYWGVCRGIGHNHLGRLLMDVRKALKIHRGSNA